MHASGESASTITAMLGVSRATIYRALAAVDSDGAARWPAHHPWATDGPWMARGPDLAVAGRTLIA